MTIHLSLDWLLWWGLILLPQRQKVPSSNPPFGRGLSVWGSQVLSHNPKKTKWGWVNWWSCPGCTSGLFFLLLNKDTRFFYMGEKFPGDLQDFFEVVRKVTLFLQLLSLGVTTADQHPSVTPTLCRSSSTTSMNPEVCLLSSAWQLQIQHLLSTFRHLSHNSLNLSPSCLLVFFLCQWIHQIPSS